MRLAAALLLLALPAAAEEVVTGEEFRALAEGQTLHFELGGGPYGSEQYLPGNRTLWRFGTEECEEGVWWEEAGTICFRYDSNPVSQCWIVTRRNGDVFARTVDDADGSGELRLARRDREPLACPGPNVGV